MASGSQSSSPPGPPYALDTAGVGGLPTVTEDIPPLAVFLVLYIVGAVSNMTILQLNLRKGHKFLISGALFGFCMSRITTVIMRIVWATRPSNVRIAIAADVLVNAGTLFLYIVNLLLALRILRALQPRIGWHAALDFTIKVLFGLTPLALVLIITVTIISFYTRNQHTKGIARGIQLGAITYLLIVAVAPLPLLALPFLIRHPPHTKQTFGQGSMRARNIILAVGTCFCVLIGGFRAGTSWETPRAVSDPAWYDHKACFYIFNFTCEIVVLYLYTLSRIDQRFHVPDGSGKVRTYEMHDPLGSSEDEVLDRDEKKRNRQELTV